MFLAASACSCLFYGNMYLVGYTYMSCNMFLQKMRVFGTSMIEALSCSQSPQNFPFNYTYRKNARAWMHTYIVYVYNHTHSQARRASLALQSFRTFTARDEYEEEDTGATLMYTLQGNIYNSENSKSNHHYGYHQQQQKTRHSLEHPRQQHIQTGGRSDSSRLAGLVSLPPPLPPHASSSSSPSSPFRSPASRRAAKHVITPTRARTNTQTHSYDNRMYTPHRSPTIPLPSYSSSPSAQYSKYYKGSPSDNGASANKLRAGPLLAPLHPVNSHKHSHSTHSKYSHASSPRTNNYGYHTDRTHSRSRYL